MCDIDDLPLVTRSLHLIRRGGVCSAIQSRYERQPADLPLSGRRVELTVVTRRFWCDAVLCGRRIFCERFGDNVVAR
jgi:hypothetical protein